MDKYITMAYGSGGKKTSELIESVLVPAFSNDELNRLNDGAYIDTNYKRMVFSTDSFVINPLFFPGGDIGKLSVCGTVNDISVCGAIPKYLSLSFIIEEGFLTEDLIKIVASIKKTSDGCGVKIVTGDTKVVEKGHCDGIYINTSGIGFMEEHIELGTQMMVPGDKVIVSGTMGDHGLAVMAARGNLFQSEILLSDCTPVNRLTGAVMMYKNSVRIMRDPTRGGLATTLKEFITDVDLDIKIFNDLIPVKREVRAACSILGIDPLYAANEGKIVIIADQDAAEDIVKCLRSFPEGCDASIIGEVVDNGKGRLLYDTGLGSVRIMDKLSGDQLPRIC